MMMAWNCRGIGSPSAIQHLKDLVWEHQPDVMFLSETKAKKRKMLKVQKQIKYQGMEVVDPIGRSGGLALFWKEGVDLEILIANKNHISGKISNYPANKDWFFSFVYGHPVSHHRKIVWNDLRNFAGVVEGPWALMGDFNAIMAVEEKNGGNEIITSSMKEFNDLIQELGLFDLGFTGPKFTWCNNRSVGNQILERLDRVLGSEDWVKLFPTCVVKSLSNASSDHLVLTVSLNQKEEGGPKPFRFFDMWLKKKSCKEVIAKAWKSRTEGGLDEVVKEKMDQTRKHLRIWNKKEFGNIFFEKRKIERELNTLLEDMNDENYVKWQGKREELAKVIEMEESYWQQNSSGNPSLKEGGRSSRYFHLSTIYRRRRNRIYRIKNEEGEWKDKREEVNKVFLDYFQKVFTSEEVEEDGELLELFQPVVSDEDNVSMVEIPLEEEIWKVIKSMGALKAPGPDGFQGIFYKACWEIVKDDVIALVQEFFRSGTMPAEINETFIALIPKVADPDCPSKFRPIALCNFIYKIITKILANRLKPQLDNIVSPHQAAFVKGRCIGDNASVVQEIFANMKKMKRKKQGWMAVKMDMAKAYDRVEWGFLEKILEKLGFCEKWRQLVHQCLSSITFRVMINGTPSEEFKSTRGIRQGDPLSPYLFIIMAESLSRLVIKGEQEGVVSGIKIRRKGPAISHLLYADDLILFCKASLDEAGNLLDILKRYCGDSGQAVNFSKSSAYFSTNVHSRHQKILLRMWKVKRFHEKEKYLGNPVLLSRKKREDFDYILSKVQSRIAGWMAKTLSQAGRAILIKAVVETIPIYTMSTNLLPVSICDEIDQMKRNFFWDGTFGSKAIHTMPWGSLVMARGMGGLGFRNTRDMNIAMLTKHWRKIATDQTHWADFFKGMYPKWKKIWYGEEKGKGDMSYFWRGVVKAAANFRKGALYKVGNGEKIKILEDPWLKLNGNVRKISEIDMEVTCDKVWVSELMENGNWN
ncbi:hypothetical protein ACHQM5_022190 [Ranunculus cassubicifolius]